MLSRLAQDAIFVVVVVVVVTSKARIIITAVRD